MAKKDEEAVVQVQTDAAEGTQEETTQQPANGEQNSENNAPKRPSDKKAGEKKPTVEEQVRKVKIHTTKEVNCIIACVPYVIAANKDAQVPADVAAILVNAQKAYRI